jgi:hypothetical protein
MFSAAQKLTAVGMYFTHCAVSDTCVMTGAAGRAASIELRVLMGSGGHAFRPSEDAYV